MQVRRRPLPEVVDWQFVPLGSACSSCNLIGRAAGPSAAAAQRAAGARRAAGNGRAADVGDVLVARAARRPDTRSVSCMVFCLHASVPYCFQMSYGLQLVAPPSGRSSRTSCRGRSQLQSRADDLAACVHAGLADASGHVRALAARDRRRRGRGGQQTKVIDSTPPLPHIGPGSRREMNRFFCAQTSPLRIL